MTTDEITAPTNGDAPATEGQAAREALAEQIASLADARGHRLAVAESLTGGLLASDLAKANGAGSWFQGGVVSYATRVKQDVLNVRPGPVVSEAAACDMATGAARLCHADVAVAVTGVGGPDEQEGNPPGTVWVATYYDSHAEARLLQLEGSPAEICSATCELALRHLLERITTSA